MPNSKRPSQVDKALVREQLGHVSSKLGGRKKMAEKCGLQLPTVKSWFRGRRPVTPNIQLLIQVADAAEVSLDWLVRGRGPMEWSLIGRVQVMAAVQKRLASRVGEEYHQASALSAWRALRMLNRDLRRGLIIPNLLPGLLPELGEEVWNDELEAFWNLLLNFGADHFEGQAEFDDEEPLRGNP